VWETIVPETGPDSPPARSGLRPRGRWRDPSGREHKRSFNRKTDAQRFLVGVEDAKLRNAYVDPPRARSAR
jgi:hypothetical protein